MLPVDKVFVLNLDRRPARWARTKSQFDAVGVPAVRFPAVDGAARAFLATYWSGDIPQKTFRSPGALACLLSHIRILECAQLHGYKRIAVFEDDVLLHKNFCEELRRLEQLPPWKIVYLGASQVRWAGVTESGVPGFYRPNNTCGTWAMLLDSSAFAPILRIYRQFSCTADLGLVSLFNDDPQAFVASPNICICDVGESDIRTASLAELPKHAKWDPTYYTSPNSFTASG
jgi:hypothetical protein